MEKNKSFYGSGIVMIILGVLISLVGGFVILDGTENILSMDAGSFFIMIIGAIVASGLILAGIIIEMRE